MSLLVVAHSLFSNYDVELFSTGHHNQLYNKFGSHVIEINGSTGVYFAVYPLGLER